MAKTLINDSETVAENNAIDFSNLPASETPTQEAQPIAEKDPLEEILAGYQKPLSVEGEGLTQPIVEEKRGRGRPKKDGSNPQQNYTKTADGKVVLESAFITGALFLTMCDLVFPAIIATVNNMVSKDKIPMHKLQFTDKQKKDLEPAADHVAKLLMLNPIAVLVISMAGIYGSNLIAAKHS